MQVWQYDAAWASLQQEVVDENHPFSRTYQAFVTALYLLDILAYPQAITLLTRVSAEAIQLRRPWLRELAVVHLGRALALSGQQDENTLRATAQELAGMNATLLSRIIGQPTVARGEIALALGQPAAALQPVEEGLIAAAAEGRRPDLLMGQELKARLLLQMDDPEAAIAVANEALTLAASMSHLPLIWRLQATRAQAQQRLERSRTAAQAFQVAATIIHQLAATIPDGALKAAFLTAPPILSIIATQNGVIDE